MVHASWSMKEFQQALRMKRRGVTCANIAAALGRSTTAVEAKLKYCGKTPVKFPMTGPPEVPMSAIEEQIKRNTAHHRDLTGEICGDPPAGYSAFDREATRSANTRRDLDPR
jgi:hypothetical protein